MLHEAISAAVSREHYGGSLAFPPLKGLSAGSFYPFLRKHIIPKEPANEISLVDGYKSIIMLFLKHTRPRPHF